LLIALLFPLSERLSPNTNSLLREGTPAWAPPAARERASRGSHTRL
jgi:hypothetical protein